MAGLARFREQLRACRAQLELSQPPRLVHGDLWPRNVLVEQHDDGWRISAILDAERAFWGEPAAEWIFGFLDLPQAFWEAYGTRLDPQHLDGDLLLRSRVYQAVSYTHLRAHETVLDLECRLLLVKQTTHMLL